MKADYSQCLQHSRYQLNSNETEFTVTWINIQASLQSKNRFIQYSSLIALQRIDLRVLFKEPNPIVNRKRIPQSSNI